jgi:hypothetical protein
MSLVAIALLFIAFALTLMIFSGGEPEQPQKPAPGAAEKTPD